MPETRCNCPRVDGYVIPRKSCGHHVRRDPQPEAEVLPRDPEADEIACAWSDYRSAFGASGRQQHKAFVAGFKAARGVEQNGVQR